MADRGQVSSPLFWRLWLIAYIGLGVSLLASIVFPAFGIRAAYGELYPVAWGVFVLPIVVGVLARWRQSDPEPEPQTRLDDFENGT